MPCLTIAWPLLALLQTAPASLPPDRQALEAAQALPDPQQKIDALRKLIADFPTSRYVARANVVVFETLLQRFPTDTAAIAAQADAVLAAASADDHADQENYVALQLSNARVLLERAQALAEDAARHPQTTNARQRAGYLATLGGVYARRGRIADAERAFSDAYQLAPTLTRAAEGIADISLRLHRDRAYDDLVRARATGLLTPDHQRALEELYATSHHGSLEGLDALVDQTYRTLFPPAIPRVDRYVPTRARTDRIVLAELFTGSGCPPCAGADAAMDAVMERYRSNEVIALLHHLHVPRPDPMTNPDTVAHAKAYHALGTPMLFVDGAVQRGFAGDRENAPDLFAHVTPAIDRALDTPAEATVDLRATLEGGVVKVHAESTNAPRSADLTVALVEKEIRYGGENGVRFHPMVVRALATASSPTIDREFDLARLSDDLKRYLDDFEQHNAEFGVFSFAEKKHEIDPRRLRVVAFVQDAATRHVLQSAAADVAEHTNPIQWSLRRAESTPIARGETTTVQLVAKIDEGWHLYGLDLPDNGPTPTAISLPAGQPFTLAGPIDAAKGKAVFDANFGMKLELYTGTATFGLPVRAAPTATVGSHRLAVQARYQSCSDTICLPPRTVTVELPLEVR